MYPLVVAWNVLSCLIASVTHRAAAFVCHSLRTQKAKGGQEHVWGSENATSKVEVQMSGCRVELVLPNPRTEINDNRCRAQIFSMGGLFFETK